MKLYIIIGLVIIVGLILIFSRKKSKNTALDVIRVKRIEDCISKEDVNYQISYETQRVLSAIEENEATIKKAMAIADRNVSTAWINSYKKVVKIATNLDQNLKFHSSKHLEYSKFQYYTSLHFRSMIAADITYKEYKEIDSNFQKMNELIVVMAKSKNNMGLSKAQIYLAKDALKALRKVFLNRVHELNHQTEKFRDKIGIECGERGRIWWEERMKNRI